MKKKKLVMVLVISACGIVLINMQLIGMSQSRAERGFTHRFGANGYLLNAATRFRDYEFDEAACNKKRKTIKKKHQKKCRRKK